MPWWMKSGGASERAGRACRCARTTATNCWMINSATRRRVTHSTGACGVGGTARCGAGGAAVDRARVATDLSVKRADARLLTASQPRPQPGCDHAHSGRRRSIDRWPHRPDLRGTPASGGNAAEYFIMAVGVVAQCLGVIRRHVSRRDGIDVDIVRCPFVSQ